MDPLTRDTVSSPHRGSFGTGFDTISTGIETGLDDFCQRSVESRGYHGDMNTTNRFPLRMGRHLYLVQNKLTGNIKIGSTNRVEKRIRELEHAAGMPLELLR